MAAPTHDFIHDLISIFQRPVEPTIQDWISASSALVAALTFVVGVGTLIKAIIEYNRQNATKRFEIFQGMNKRFDDDTFKKIREYLDNDDPELEKHDYTSKHNFLGFFEEIAISVNTKVMSSEVAYYMFGYYAIRCYHSANFWKGAKMLSKDSIYWSLFRQFATEMEVMEKKLLAGTIRPETLKF
jgi:hypothetical protein